jgi:hypothetical protein
MPTTEHGYAQADRPDISRVSASPALRAALSLYTACTIVYSRCTRLQSAEVSVQQVSRTHARSP